MDVRLFANNVLPSALLNVDSLRSPLAFRDLIVLEALATTFCCRLQTICARRRHSARCISRGSRADLMLRRFLHCATAARHSHPARFSGLWLHRSAACRRWSGCALALYRGDVLFDAVDQCRLRFNVTIALGSLLVVPREPILTRAPRIGEAVRSKSLIPAILVDSMDRLSQALLVAGSALSPQPPAMRTLSHNQPGLMDSRVELAIDRSLGVRELDRHIGLEIDRSIGIQERDRHIDLGNRSSFDVSAWLGGGVLEIPASFAAVSDPSSKTIHVAADVRQSTAKFTDLSHDAALLLSESDPLGLVQTTTQARTAARRVLRSWRTFPWSADLRMQTQVISVHWWQIHSRAERVRAP